jgi:hypothetical protein
VYGGNIFRLENLVFRKAYCSKDVALVKLKFGKISIVTKTKRDAGAQHTGYGKFRHPHRSVGNPSST